MITKRDVGTGLLVGLAVIMVWHLSTLLLNISSLVLPTPGSVLRAAIVDHELLAQHLVITLTEVVIGLVIGGAMACTVAFGIVGFTILQPIALPFVAAAASAPKVVFAPTLIAAFGLGVASKVATAALFAFFPICVNLVSGLFATPKELLDTSRMLQLSQARAFFQIRLPAAAPHLVAGLRLAVSAAFIGAVVAEFIASSGGAGYFIKLTSGQLQADRAFAMAFCVIFMSGTAQVAVTFLANRSVYLRR